MNREASLQRLADAREPWDLVVIGGGATGAGIAVDAASRGYAVALFERADFGQGTSSRSTKLIHGGVRYLRAGRIGLVMESLKERGLLLRNAPHVVHDLAFIIPSYAWWETPFHGAGLKIYDLLARRSAFSPSEVLSREEVLKQIPTLRPDGLRGGVKYSDGQFDDARLLINLVQTAAEQGAVMLNYARVTDLKKDPRGHVTGLTFRDEETGTSHLVAARVVINATGPFCDAVRHLDEPAAPAMIAPSQGIHLVLGRDFLPGQAAIMVPRTRDGRVMFAIPWHGRALLGTTDTAIGTAPPEPDPLESEIEFLLETAAAYLARPPARADILSIFTGIRPLVKAGAAASTARLSRDHTIVVAPSGLLTITGGKWTTYRQMAEDAVDRASAMAGLGERACVTRDLLIHGHGSPAGTTAALEIYGSDAVEIEALIRRQPDLGNDLHPALPISGAQVQWAARREFARTVEDVLARRTRALFLDSQAAVAMAAAVARLLAAELGRDKAWEQAQVASFHALAVHYFPR